MIKFIAKLTLLVNNFMIYRTFHTSHRVSRGEINL